MAKRRYGSADSVHLTRRRYYAQGVRNEARNVERQAKQGRCSSAAHSLLSLGQELGGLVSEARGSGTTNDATISDLQRAARASAAVFRQRCLKARKK